MQEPERTEKEEDFGGRKREGISSNRPLNLEIAGVAGVEYRERSENRRCRPIEIRATNVEWRFRRSEVAFWLRR